MNQESELMSQINAAALELHRFWSERAAGLRDDDRRGVLGYAPWTQRSPAPTKHAGRSWPTDPSGPVRDARAAPSRGPGRGPSSRR